MNKKKIGPSSTLYPMPTTIIGANVKGKPNFLTIAYCGIIEFKPPTIFIASGKNHYTNIGIKENQTFSVNIPSADMAEVTDHIGIYSGNEIDKSELFDVFYGELQTAPMVKEAPLNLECKVVKTIDIGGRHDLFVGEIVETHVNEDCLIDGKPDVKKINPIIFSMHDNNYWKIGELIGGAWKIGRDYKKKD